MTETKFITGPWTIREDEMLRKIWAKPEAEITAALGRSWMSCCRKARALGLPARETLKPVPAKPVVAGPPPVVWAPSVDYELERLWVNGRSLEDVAAILRRPCSVVMRRLFELGLSPTPKRGWGFGDDIELRKMWKNGGVSLREMAVRLDRTESAIAARAQELFLGPLKKGYNDAP